MLTTLPHTNMRGLSIRDGGSPDRESRKAYCSLPSSGIADTTQNPGLEESVVLQHHDSDHHGAECLHVNGHVLDQENDVERNDGDNIHTYQYCNGEARDSDEHSSSVSRPSNGLEAAVRTPAQLHGPRLTRYSQAHHFKTAFDVFLVLVAACFVVFAALVRYSDGKSNEPGSLGRGLVLAASYVSSSHICCEGEVN